MLIHSSNRSLNVWCVAVSVQSAGSIAVNRDEVLLISHDSLTEVVLALMCEFLPHQHICLLIRGQQANFPIVTVAA